MAEINTNKVDKAIRFAAERHSGTPRKGTETPYIVHPMEAAAIVAGITDDPDLIAAALLHDTIEDTETTYEEIAEAFGTRIADLVKGESEDKQKDKLPAASWKERKQKTLDELKGADHESMILVLGDKLSNIRAIQRDKDALNEKLWERFNQKDPRMHAWYYSEIAKILRKDSELKETQAYKEYARIVDEVFGDLI